MKVWLLPLLMVGGFAVAADLRDAAAVPHLGPRGEQGYREFLASGMHRAFAIAPGGAWAWQANESSVQAARRVALDACAGNTDQTCVIYAADGRVVLDAKAWPTLWEPYAPADVAAHAPTGVRRGERFPDLAFRDAAGTAHTISAYRGKVLVVHFWGSWCGPCRRELPDLQRLVRKMKKDDDIRFVFLPVRESFRQAADWARTQKLDLPLFDSGVDGGPGPAFMLADGSRLPDRQVAGKFPTTYVLDKHGLVVMAHIGDASRWIEYAPFLRNAADKSGK